MKKNVAVVLGILILLAALPSGNTQSLTGDTLVLEYENVSRVHPTQTSTMPLSQYEHIADIVNTEDGEIYIYLVNMSLPQNVSLVKYDNGQLRTLATGLPPALGGFESFEDSFFFIEDVLIEENRTILLLTEKDLLGNTVAQSNMTIEGVQFYPERFLVGDDGELYLMGTDFFTLEVCLVKMNSDRSVVWTRLVGPIYSARRDFQVMTSGQVFILKDSGIESRNSDGEYLWNTTLSSDPDWMPGSVHILDDTSVCVRSVYVTKLGDGVGAYALGATIYRCDVNGNILWNTTLAGRNSEGVDSEVSVYWLAVESSSIQIILSVLEAEDNPYIIEVSKDLGRISKWGPDLSISNWGLNSPPYPRLLSENGATIVLCENGTGYDRHLVAYTFGEIPTTIILIVGGCVILLGTVLIIWKKRRAV